MKKILVIASTAPSSGGSYQYVHTLLSSLAYIDPKRFSFSVWAADREWESILQKMGLRQARKPRFGHYKILTLLQRIPLAALRDKLVSLWSKLDPLYVYIRLNQIDAVIIPDQYSLPLSKNVRQIACIHDLMHLYEKRFPEVGADEQVRSRDEGFSQILSRCSGVLVDSTLAVRQVVDSYEASPDKLFPLPFALYDSLLGCHPERPRQLAPNYDGNYLFYPAQFWLHKNHVSLLDAVNKLPKELDIHCVFTGGAEKNGSSAITTAIERLALASRVQILGFVSINELAWLYTHARCMVMPTFFGPTNIPPLEAMHFGCPVAVSGIYGMPDQLGDAALYFRPDDVDDMANVIQTLWLDEDVRKILIQKGTVRASRATAKYFGESFSEILKTVFSDGIAGER